MELIIRGEKKMLKKMLEVYPIERVQVNYQVKNEMVFEVEDDDCEEMAYEISQRFGVFAFCR